eukprot:786590_1
MLCTVLHTSQFKRKVINVTKVITTSDSSRILNHPYQHTFSRGCSGIASDKKTGILSRFLDQPVASKSFHRWLAVPPALLAHLSIGSVYSWSIMNAPLANSLGVVAPAAGDWKLSQIVPIVSTTFLLHGISAALLGKWQERVGPRRSLAYGTVSFGGGMLLGGLGASLHSITLMYIGYGFLGGCGLGFAYVPPMANLIRWFPDRRGLATGITICGFGGGALISAPLMQILLNQGKRIPEYLGTVENIATTLVDGRLFAEVGDKLTEVVVATHGDLTIWKDAAEGVYVVGTGSTGAALTFTALGIVYFSSMLTSAVIIRTPPDGWIPKGFTPPKSSTGDGITHRNVHIDNVMKTPQFYLLWSMFTSMAMAGMAVVSTAKDMMMEIFGGTMPHVVTPGFAAGFVVALSAFNLMGRLGWSSLSDTIGRRRTFHIICLGSIPMFIAIPMCVSAAAAWPVGASQTAFSSLVPLIGFYGTSVLFVSMFGGTYATVPAYEADIFGSKYI